MEKAQFFAFFLVAIAFVYSIFMFFDVEFRRETNIPVHVAIKRIAYWNSFFGDPDWKGHSNDRLNICPYRCTFHTDRRDPLMYDALIFHGRDGFTIPKKRSPNQIYIMLLMESPYHRGSSFVKGDSFYNWSATYHRKSEIWMPYWTFHRKSKEDSQKPHLLKLPQLTYKRRSSESFIAWVVSNCNTPGKREEYVRILRRFINVDTFGACGSRCDKGRRYAGIKCHQILAQSGVYKFYLSFENSACRDYITEKGANPLRTGIVPIVYGGLEAEDYRRKFPPNSYIDVRNFPSPKALANYLHYLDNNDTAYMAYFDWKRDYELTKRDGQCAICMALHNSSLLGNRNINWAKYWNPTSDCDRNFIDKVKG